MQMSTSHGSFDYCISHKTISYRAAAAPGPEVRRECHDLISSFAPPRNKSWRRHCLEQIHAKYTQIEINKSTHSEIGPVRQNPIQRTVRTARLSMLTLPEILAHGEPALSKKHSRSARVQREKLLLCTAVKRRGCYFAAIFDCTCKRATVEK